MRIKKLIKQLQDKSDVIRIKAMDELAEIGVSVIDELKEVIENESTAALGFQILGKIPDIKSAELVISFLVNRKRLHATELAARTLVCIGQPAVDPLVKAVTEALFDRVNHIDRHLIWIFGELRDPRGIESIIILLNRSSPFQQEAIEALAKIGKPAVDPLIRLVKTEQHLTVSILALGQIGDKRAVEPLMNVLSGNRTYKETAADALGRIGDDRAVPLLIAALNEKEIGDRWLRERAAWALGKIKDERALEPLTVLIKDEETDVRLSAVEALRKFRDVRLSDTFNLALKDRNRKIRQRATKAIGEIKNLNTIENLTKSLKDRSKDVRIKAIKALGSIDSVESVKLLCESLSDKDPKVRIEVAVTLGTLGKPNAIVPLLSTLNDDTHYVRIAALRSLETLACTCDIDAFISATLDDKYPKHTKNMDEIVPYELIKAAIKGNKLDSHKQLFTALSMIEIIFETYTQALKLKSSSSVDRGEAISKLGKIDHPIVIEHLISAIDDEDESVRYYAASALDRLQGSKTASLVFNLINGNTVDWTKIRAETSTARMKKEFYRLLKLAIFERDTEEGKRAWEMLEYLMER